MIFSPDNQRIRMTGIGGVLALHDGIRECNDVS